ncbi:fibroblast growth factor 18-like [Hemicordylus capensis]|uniref:fibroblast growth factor 18-like n=1 Tax=Hemicordylus capensis TaxID=884348 RepID=UPI002302561C|nr:fibroblast growth factor 18-like [Hemicordylus capensis]
MIAESLQAVADFRLYVENHTRQHPEDPSRRHTRTYQLYSRTSSRHVQVLPGRLVLANGEDGNKYALLAVESDAFGSRVRIRGQETGLYVCMGHRGHVRAKLNGRGRACVFAEELLENHYTAFESAQHHGWYLGFTRRGRPLRGSRIQRRHRQGHFMKRCPRGPAGQGRAAAVLIRFLAAVAPGHSGSSPPPQDAQAAPGGPW